MENREKIHIFAAFNGMIMKKTFAIIAALIALAGCGNTHNNIQEEDSEGVNPETEEIMCGGFTAQREPTEDEMAMFRKATDDDGLIVYTPLSVATQVVAGINYRFYCRFEDLSPDVHGEEKDPEQRYGHCFVKIYKPLPGNGEPRVTSVSGNCDTAKQE